MAKTVRHEELNAYFGDEDHLQVSQGTKFSDLVFESLAERKPNDGESKVFELILNLSIDHGEETPSAVEVIKSAKEGESMGEAVGEGLEEIGDAHGGAGKPLMEILYRVKREGENVKGLISDYLEQEKKMPGVGHRIYKDIDPRAQLILETAQSNGINMEYADILKQIEVELESQKGRKLPINIDGAMAAVFCGMDLKPDFAIAAFIVARVPGLTAHYLNNSK